MQKVIVTRKIDKLGRVCIPKKIMKEIGFKTGELVTIETIGDEVIIGRVGKHCSICGKQSELKVNDKYICNECISYIKKLDEEDK